MMRYYDSIEELVNESIEDFKGFEIILVDLNYDKKDSEYIAGEIIKKLKENKEEVKTSIIVSYDTMYNLRIERL